MTGEVFWTYLSGCYHRSRDCPALLNSTPRRIKRGEDPPDRLEPCSRCHGSGPAGGSANGPYGANRVADMDPERFGLQ